MKNDPFELKMFQNIESLYQAVHLKKCSKLSRQVVGSTVLKKDKKPEFTHQDELFFEGKLVKIKLLSEDDLLKLLRKNLLNYQEPIINCSQMSRFYKEMKQRKIEENLPEFELAEFKASQDKVKVECQKGKKAYIFGTKTQFFLKDIKALAFNGFVVYKATELENSGLFVHFKPYSG